MSRIDEHQEARIRELEAELVKWKAEVYERGKIIAGLNDEVADNGNTIEKLRAQLQAIDDVKAGRIKIQDTGTIHLESPTYCAFCGQIFPEAVGSTEQIRAHLIECPKHPLRAKLSDAQQELVGKDLMLQARDKQIETLKAELARLKELVFGDEFFREGRTDVFGRCNTFSGHAIRYCDRCSPMLKALLKFQQALRNAIPCSIEGTRSHQPNQD